MKATKPVEPTCRICGCTETTACFHPKHGNCWWVEKDLCSHCQKWPGQSTLLKDVIIKTTITFLLLILSLPHQLTAQTTIYQTDSVKQTTYGTGDTIRIPNQFTTTTFALYGKDSLRCLQTKKTVRFNRQPTYFNIEVLGQSGVVFTVAGGHHKKVFIWKDITDGITTRTLIFDTPTQSLEFHIKKITNNP